MWYHWILNDDNPTPPASYRPGEHEQWRMLCWLGRNFAHNLAFYYVGLTGKPFVSYGRYPKDVWNPHDGWNWAIRRYRWVLLPFVSYRGRVEVYAGWRERGNLGFACRRRHE